MLGADWLQLPSEWLAQTPSGLHRHIDWSQLGQMAILFLVGFGLYIRFIRQSQAEQLMKGLFFGLVIFVSLFSLALYFKLNLLVAAFGYSLQILILALIVIFQPELRRMLFVLGKPERFGERIFSLAAPEEQAEHQVQELTEALRFLSKSKTGALIVLTPNTNPDDHFLEAGTPINATLSTELLLTIFHTNTPLHDGAVIISPDNRILSAGVLLPLTENPRLSWQYGTRHRAAIGFTEVSDSHCLVVSEETGTISLAHDGKLEKLTGQEEVKKRLEKIYSVGSSKREGKLISLGQRFSDILPEKIQQLFSRRGSNDTKGAKKPNEKPSPKTGSGG